MFSYSHLRKLLFYLPPEGAHTLAEYALRFGAHCPFLFESIAKRLVIADARLSQTVAGVQFRTPIGMAAGFDKNGTMIRALTALAFGFLEVGTVTPKPQNGNAKPRLWRHIDDQSLQNSFGFNNDGVEALVSRLKTLYPYALPIGVNAGKNKTTPLENALDDYKICIEKSHEYADYIALNLSSPNTPNLRDLQNGQFVSELFAMARGVTAKPIFLKIAPDLPPSDAITLAQTAITAGASGIIAANTTNDYSLITGSSAFGGGLSGAVLTHKSRALFTELSRELFGTTVLISSGGVMNADEAWERITLGANLVQVFTGFVYGGACFAHDLSLGILERLTREGFANIGEAIGSRR